MPASLPKARAWTQGMAEWPILGTHLENLEVSIVTHAIHPGRIRVQVGIATRVPLKLQGLCKDQHQGKGQYPGSLSRLTLTLTPLAPGWFTHLFRGAVFVLVSPCVFFVLGSFILMIIDYFLKLYLGFESESHSVMSDSSQLFTTVQSMEFSRPEHWNGYLPLLQGIFPNQESRSPILQGESSPAE